MSQYVCFTKSFYVMSPCTLFIRNQSFKILNGRSIIDPSFFNRLHCQYTMSDSQTCFNLSYILLCALISESFYCLRYEEEWVSERAIRKVKLNPTWARDCSLGDTCCYGRERSRSLGDHFPSPDPPLSSRQFPRETPLSPTHVPSTPPSTNPQSESGCQLYPISVSPLSHLRSCYVTLSSSLFYREKKKKKLPLGHAPLLLWYYDTCYMMDRDSMDFRQITLTIIEEVHSIRSQVHHKIVILLSITYSHICLHVYTVGTLIVVKSSFKFAFPS